MTIVHVIRAGPNYNKTVDQSTILVPQMKQMSRLLVYFVGVTVENRKIGLKPIEHPDTSSTHSDYSCIFMRCPMSDCQTMGRKLR
jgi:hypothetical protein